MPTRSAVLKTIIENLSFEPQKYSGKGMYGRNCVGFTCEKPLPTVFQLGVEYESLHTEYSENDEEWPFQGNLRICMDNMGQEFIVYFPNIAWED